MRPQDATTCDHVLFVSVLWSHIGDHASAATNQLVEVVKRRSLIPIGLGGYEYPKDSLAITSLV